MIHLYGIPNCDTIRKARKWLADHGVDYNFHDYKKESVDKALLQIWCDKLDWEILLNRRGTTWRQLPESEKADVDQDKAIKLMIAHPAMIKRPVLVCDQTIEVGFSEASYTEIFG